MEGVAGGEEGLPFLLFSPEKSGHGGGSGPRGTADSRAWRVGGARDQAICLRRWSRGEGAVDETDGPHVGRGRLA